MKNYIAISMMIFTVAQELRAADFNQHTATNLVRNWKKKHHLKISNEQVRRLVRNAYS